MQSTSAILIVHKAQHVYQSDNSVVCWLKRGRVVGTYSPLLHAERVSHPAWVPWVSKTEMIAAPIISNPSNPPGHPLALSYCLNSIIQS